MNYMEQKADDQITAGIEMKDALEARIVLAVVMGWTHAEDKSNLAEWKGMWFRPDGAVPMPCPNPFADANDDYAILEHMRTKYLGKGFEHEKQWSAFCEALWSVPTIYGSLLFYKIGDYARARLKMIDRQEGRGGKVEGGG